MPYPLAASLLRRRSPLRATTAGVLVVLAAMAASATGAGAQAPAVNADSAAVVSTVARFHEALAKGDSAAALALLAPDVTVLESGGVESLADYRGHHLPADIAFARAVPSTRTLVSARVRGDVAWVTGTSETRGTFRERPVDTIGAELMVLSRHPDGWRIQAIHWSARARRPSR